jgi:predicted transposase/invertase (TIGR01784 family)
MDKAIQEAQRKIAYVSNDDEAFLHAYEMREIGLSDWNSRLGDARREGLLEGKQEGLNEGEQKGLEKGRQEAIKTSAQKMKKAGMPVTQIGEYTGLSVAEIERL